MMPTCGFSSFFPLFCIECIFVRFFVYFECQGEYQNKYRNSKSWSRMIMPKANNNDNKIKIFESRRTFIGVLWGKLMTYCLLMCGKSRLLCLSGSGVKHLEQNFKNSRFGIRKPEFAFWRAMFLVMSLGPLINLNLSIIPKATGWLWSSYFISLHLTFVTCETQEKLLPFSLGCKDS